MITYFVVSTGCEVKMREGEERDKEGEEEGEEEKEARGEEKGEGRM